MVVKFLLKQNITLFPKDVLKRKKQKWLGKDWGVLKTMFLVSVLAGEQGESIDGPCSVKGFLARTEI
ncbi:MAG: hypothetical protein CM15mV103_210 [uncultured marine virus]|nr:MAG: hypothetical protein CM15mV103_210 [uncultured marine virus]